MRTASVCVVRFTSVHVGTEKPRKSRHLQKHAHGIMSRVVCTWHRPPAWTQVVDMQRNPPAVKVASAEKHLVKDNLGHVVVQPHQGASQPQRNRPVSTNIDHTIAEVVGLEPLAMWRREKKKGKKGVVGGMRFGNGGQKAESKGREMEKRQRKTERKKVGKESPEGTLYPASPETWLAPVIAPHCSPAGEGGAA